MIYSFPVQRDQDIFIPNQFDQLSLVWTHICVSYYQNLGLGQMSNPSHVE